MKLYFNKNVYSPEYSSIDTILIADKFMDGNPTASVLDVGCGSGMIGLGIKKLRPNSTVTLCDIDKKAIEVSNINSKRLGLDVSTKVCDMIDKKGSWDIITANLPTYGEEDMKQELHGPEVAYYSKEPLAMYDKLFKDAKGRCRALVCECQAKYQKEFLELADKWGWLLVMRTDFGFGFVPKLFSQDAKVV